MPADHLNPTDQLRREHALILEALAIAKTMAARLRTGQAVEQEDLRAFVEFIRDFADNFHHAGEEEALFPWMAARGGGMVAMPLSCMHAEHEAGRRMLASIDESTDGLPATAGALADLLTLFVSHLEAHIRKEDMVIFPMASQFGEDDPALREAFQQARPDATGMEGHYQGVVDRLGERYTPVG